MMIYDSHVHIFNSKIAGNVIKKTGLIERLGLEIQNIKDRLTPAALIKELRLANVQAALMLPTADASNIQKTNRDWAAMASGIPELFTAGTLHPGARGIEAELAYLEQANIRVIKLCSFSQKFSLVDSKTYRMFDLIHSFNRAAKTPFTVVLDTPILADQYFGTNPEYTTTPQAFMDLAKCFPGINFIGAHMGGLGAPFEILNRYLKPLPNLCLDTSNAAHTLAADEFVQMLHRHGPEHILFGTDWPWFSHKKEIRLIDDLMETAGFKIKEKEAVFGLNLEKILGITRAC